MTQKKITQKKIKVTLTEQELQIIASGVYGLRLGDSIDFGIKLREILKAVENGQVEYIDDSGADES